MLQLTIIIIYNIIMLQVYVLCIYLNNPFKKLYVGKTKCTKNIHNKNFLLKIMSAV